MTTMGSIATASRDYSMFRTSEDPVIPELPSVYVPDPSEIENSKSSKGKLNSAMSGIKSDSKRFYNFVKKHIKLRRREKSTAVKSINIVPEDDGSTWARRSASSAASRSSVDSASSCDSAMSRDHNLQVVHDMDNEYGFSFVAN